MNPIMSAALAIDEKDARIADLEAALREIWSATRDMDDELLEHIHRIASRTIITKAR